MTARRDRPPSPQRPTPPLVERFLTSLTAERNASRATIAAYRADLLALAAFLTRRGKPVEGAHEADIDAFLAAEAKRGIAARSRARRLSALRQFHRFLAAEGFRAEDPSRRAAARVPGRRLPRALAPDAATRLLDARPPLEDAGEEARLGLMLELLFGSGLRVSELCALGIGQIDAERRVMRIRGKGGKERLVPLSPPAIAALAAYKPHRERFAGGAKGAALFPSRGGKPLSRQRVWQMLKSAAASAGLDPAEVSPHRLRHAFATALLEGGMDLRRLQTVLGHADIATTAIYTHVAGARSRALVESKHPLARKKPA